MDRDTRATVLLLLAIAALVIVTGRDTPPRHTTVTFVDDDLDAKAPQP